MEWSNTHLISLRDLCEKICFLHKDSERGLLGVLSWSVYVRAIIIWFILSINPFILKLFRFFFLFICNLLRLNVILSFNFTNSNNYRARTPPHFVHKQQKYLVI